MEKNGQVIGGEAPTENGSDMGANTGNNAQDVAASGAGKTGKTKPTRIPLKRKDTSTEHEAQAAKKKKIEKDDESSSEDEEDMETDAALTKGDFLKGLKKLHKKLDKVTGLQDEKIENMQSEIDGLREEIVELRNEMDQLHVITRKKNLLFTGIPEDPEEQPIQTYTKIRNFVQRELNLDAEIDTVRRVGSTKKGTGRRILVTFSSARNVEMIMENKHKLRNNRKQRVYINRDDPPRIEQAKAEVRKERKISEEYYSKYHPEEYDDEPHGSQDQTRNQQRHGTPAEARKRQTHENYNSTGYQQRNGNQNSHYQGYGSQNQNSHNQRYGSQNQSTSRYQQKQDKQNQSDHDQRYGSQNQWGHNKRQCDNQRDYYQRHERSASRQPEQRQTGGGRKQRRKGTMEY